MEGVEGRGTTLGDKLIQHVNTMEGVEGRGTTSCEPHWVTNLSSMSTPWKGLKGEEPHHVNHTG